ncbi:MAG: NAD(P)H-dependent oxidoreductase [Verrucomicrobiota bacterium]
MKTILAFGASTSHTSINRQLALAAARMVPGAEVTDLDLSTYVLPIYSSQEEETQGVPAAAGQFLEAIRSHDGIVVSLAEHNGSYAAAFKNLYDWTSRMEQKLWSEKPMLLLSTSPGGRGGASVMDAAKATFPRMGANVVGTFSLPSFGTNFSVDQGVTDQALAAALSDVVKSFGEAL